MCRSRIGRQRGGSRRNNRRLTRNTGGNSNIRALLAVAVAPVLGLTTAPWMLVVIFVLKVATYVPYLNLMLVRPL